MRHPILHGLERAIKAIQDDDFKRYRGPGASEEVRKLRANLKLSQSQLAEKLSISLDTLKSWESGRRKPSKMAAVVLEALEMGT